MIECVFQRNDLNGIKRKINCYWKFSIGAVVLNFINEIYLSRYGRGYINFGREQRTLGDISIRLVSTELYHALLRSMWAKSKKNLVAHQQTAGRKDIWSTCDIFWQNTLINQSLS